MSELLTGFRGWWLGSAMGGGLVLLAAWVIVRRSLAPNQRQRMGEWGVAAAVCVAVLRLCPAWLTVPDPRPTPPPAACAVIPVVTAPSEEPIEVAWLMGPRPEVVRDMPPMKPVVDAVGGPLIPESVTNCGPQSSWWDAAGFWLDSFATAYALIASVLLVRWILAHWGLARIVRRARPAPESVQVLFERIAYDLGRPDARLVVSDRVGVPLCCGLRTPTVVIPRALVLSNDTAVFRWVFAHELTHLARRDPWSVWGLGLAQAVFFYLPWFWWLRKHVRLCQEYVADAAAAAQGPWVDDYAEFLVSLARCPAAPAAAAGVFSTKSDLYRRVTMLLQPQSGAGSRRHLVTGVASLLASAVVLAGLGVRAETPLSDDDKKKDNVEVKVIVVDDDAKKDGDKKDAIKKKILLGDFAPLGGPNIDKGEFEKKLRKALSSAKLSEEQVDKILKEAMQSLEQAMKAHMNVVMPQGNVFALPAGEAVKFSAVAPLAGWVGAEGKPHTGRFGVMVEKPNAALVEQLDLGKDQGLVIVEVVKGSAAEKAGVKAHDLLIRFADKEVPADTTKFIKLLEGVSSDKTVEAIVIRKGHKETISGVKLAEKKEPVKVEIREKAIKAAIGERVLVEEVNPKVNKEVKESKKSVSVTINDGDFSAKEVDGDLTITVKGTVEGKKVDVQSVTIYDGESKSTYSSVSKVPSKHRARVEKLISNSGDSPVRFDSRKEKN